jgi:hypothetical protein
MGDITPSMCAGTTCCERGSAEEGAAPSFSLAELKPCPSTVRTPSPRGGGLSYIKTKRDHWDIGGPRLMRGARPGKPRAADGGGKPPHSTWCEATHSREADGRQVAEYVRRAQHAVPLRSKRRKGRDKDEGCRPALHSVQGKKARRYKAAAPQL